MQINSLGVNSVSADFSATDIETLMMMVQSQRAQLLEDSLRSQLDSVNARNQQMNSLMESNTKLEQTNRVLETDNVDMNSEIAELKELQGRLAASKHPDPNQWYGLSWGQGDDPALSHATLDQVKKAGLDIPTGADAPRDIDGNGTMDAKGKVVQGWVDQIDKKVAELESRIEQNKKDITANKDQVSSNKNQIDSLSNTQQMEMLRLQGLSNKRNEAFDVMSNFIKKMQDSRSSIVGNMR